MDMTIKCKDCDQPFTVSTKEAEWYKAKGFDLPKRCPDCRAKRRLTKDNKGD